MTTLSKLIKRQKRELLLVNKLAATMKHHMQREYGKYNKNISIYQVQGEKSAFLCSLYMSKTKNEDGT